MAAMKRQLSSVKGILLFREPGAGMHTELWDGKQILQRDMDEPHLFSRPRILGERYLNRILPARVGSGKLLA
jgi:hypothetical protein